MTPVKYECDANNLTDTFTGSKILFTEKLTNGALVTPTPALEAFTHQVISSLVKALLDINEIGNWVVFNMHTQYVCRKGLWLLLNLIAREFISHITHCTPGPPFTSIINCGVKLLINS